jgi:hypothetical protein
MGNGQSAPVPLQKHCPKIHPAIRDAIHKCLEPEAEKRFHSMKLFLNAIRSAKTETA